jgi:signal transduction histidine kinase
MQVESAGNDRGQAGVLIGTTHDITERKRAELLLEAERRRVAYDVHDGLAQVLTSTHQHLQTFAAHYRPRRPQARQELDRVLELAQLAVREARRLIAGLRPTALDDFGLAAALRLQIEALRADGWDIPYQEAIGVDRLPPAVETALFWVVQEGITNIRKHANTNRARLGLTRQADIIRLELQDHGRGFEVSAASSPSSHGEHVGLLSMQERIAMVGGSLTIHSRPGAGTLIVAEVPLVPLNTGETFHAD